MKTITQKQHLTDLIGNVKLPKKYRTDEHTTVYDVVDRKIIKAIAKDLIKESNADH